MITELLNLGIKGEDIVIEALKKIQQDKEKFSKPVNTNFAKPPVTPPQKQPVAKEETQTANKIKQQTNPLIATFNLLNKSAKFAAAGFLIGAAIFRKKPEEKETEKEKKETEQRQSVRERISEVTGTAKSTIASLGSMDAKNLMTGIGHSLDVWTAGVSGMLAETAGAVLTFKEKIRAAAQIEEETQSFKNINKRYGIEDNLFKDRSDIRGSEGAAIVDAIGSKYGKMTKDFQKSLQELYKSGETIFDAKQATQIAQGNFAATGTDKGFFLQKIADSFQGLPPSFAQKMLPELWKQLGEEDRAKQADVGIRAVNAQFDRNERAKASELSSKERIESALKIDKVQKDFEVEMAKVLGELVVVLEKGTKFLGDKIKELQSKEYPETSGKPSGIMKFVGGQ